MTLFRFAVLMAVVLTSACDGGSRDGAVRDTAVDCRKFGFSATQESETGRAWGGRGWQSCAVSMPLPGGDESLYATLFLPGDLRPEEAALPAVVIGPGAWPLSDKATLDIQERYHWAAQELASYGYVALTVNPRGFVNSAPENAEDYDEYVEALSLGLSYLVGRDNPVAWRIDARKLGLAGHSLSARVSSVLQSEIGGLAAIVAWDNLASDARGDAGSYARGNDRFGAPAVAVQPRVPAMGQASDSYESGIGMDFTEEDKKTAFNVWRSHGLESMQVVFAGADHGSWSYSLRDDPRIEPPALSSLRVYQYFTRAWFDLHLRGRVSAISKLTTPYVEGMGPQQLYSSSYLSALYLTDMASYDCADLRSGCGF